MLAGKSARVSRDSFMNEQGYGRLDGGGGRAPLEGGSRTRRASHEGGPARERASTGGKTNFYRSNNSSEPC